MITRLYRIIIFTLISLTSLYAYTQEPMVIDTTIIMCSYEYVRKVDTLTNQEREDLIYLEIGTKWSKSYSYYTHRQDSLKSTKDGQKELRRLLGIANREIQKNKNADPKEMPFARLKPIVYKDYNGRRITVLDRLRSSGNYYMYEEDMDLQDWSFIEDSTKTILGHECQMATCKFRGRIWSAWFSLDIPITDGPWKFNGLPGLILEAYDIGNQHHFTINGLQKGETEPILYGCIGIDIKEFTKTSHSNFWKAENDIHNGIDPELDIVMDKINVIKNPDFVPRFDWLEREEK